jgi:hypothetical protein
MTAPLFEAHGKQVLRGGKHFADAADPAGAELIADTLNGHGDFTRLHRAAQAYLRAASERTARIAAADLRAALEERRA